MSTSTATQLEEYKHLENQTNLGNLGKAKERTKTKMEEKTTGREEKEKTTSNRTSHGKEKARVESTDNDPTTKRAKEKEKATMATRTTHNPKEVTTTTRKAKANHKAHH
eukprot:1689081-Amphidinium_carterae.2